MARSHRRAAALIATLLLTAAALVALVVLVALPARRSAQQAAGQAQGTMTPELPTPTPTSTPSPSPTPVPTPSRAERLLEGMTLEQRVGQLFFLEYDGDYALDAASRKTLEHVQPGGYVLFSYRIRDPEQVTGLWRELQEASEVPLFAAVDEEGGPICAVSRNESFRAERFAGQRALMALGDGAYAAIEADALEKAAYLGGLGFTMNFAPVADVVSDERAALYARSYGGDPEAVARAVEAAVRGHAARGMGTSLKHFPGSGDSQADTHDRISVDRRDAQTLEARDLVPFDAGVAAGATSVMLGHVTVAAIDAELPASISPAVAALARERYGPDVLLVTDSLQMKAVQKAAGSMDEACIQALCAGVDMVLMPSPSAYDAVLRAVGEGRLSPDDIAQRALRVLRAKERLGLL